MKKGEVLKQTNLSKSYFYEIFSDKKLPSRNNFIQIIIAMQVSFEETQGALKACGYSQLYARNRWDAMIIYCIENKKKLTKTNILLESQNMPLLY